jgi:hypothetical protein
MNIEAKVRGLVLTGVLPRLADGRRKGMICSVSFLECAIKDALFKVPKRCSIAQNLLIFTP